VEESRQRHDEEGEGGKMYTRVLCGSGALKSKRKEFWASRFLLSNATTKNHPLIAHAIATQPTHAGQADGLCHYTTVIRHGKKEDASTQPASLLM
jgi:hypothetical protein